MADRFWGMNHGADPNTVTTDTSTTSKTIELRMTTGQSITRKEVFRALKAFEKFLTSATGKSTFGDV